ncbi:MAG: glucose-1-phosphate adenylyltransferase [Chloroflexi bacterium]|nr:glucose-1-phosphate adenylyltransferase [Chloroflexota bacterium]
MDKAIALILAGGRGDRLSILSEERAKPAVVFAGKYRIIDFALSNCVHSGIQKVALLTQYRPRSLNEHIGIGRPWDLDRMGGGIFLLQPYTGRLSSDWYKNTADAVHQNLSFVEESRADLVLVLAGDHIYSMRYDAMLAFHRAHGADCTVGVVEVPTKEASRYGVLTLGQEGKVVRFTEKPAHPESGTVSMGIYVFTRDALMRELERDAADPNSTHDFGTDILPGMVDRCPVYGYQFSGYWRDVGTVQSYWEANMDLVADMPQLNLYDRDHPVLTRVQSRPAAKTGPSAQITRSLVGDGCIINGVVRNSILSPGVYVEEDAVVEDSVVFDDCFIGRWARVHYSILDKEVTVGQEAVVGWGEDFTPNEEEPDRLNTGITLVGKRATVPPRTKVGRNCKVYPGTRASASAFASEEVHSGKVVGTPLP